MYADIEGTKVKLYGTIWQGDGPYIVTPLSKLLAKKEPVDIHLHGPGGSVIDGNLIYNAIAGTKNDTTIHIDGLAASMLGIIMLAGKKIKMASNAFIMLHAPSGTTQGNAKDFENTAKLLRSMEASFIKRLSSKTGKPAAELKEWMNGDNWFTADEAKEAGLIDEIVDPVIEENSDMAAYQDLKLVAQLFAKYDNKDDVADDEETPQNTPKNTPKNQEEMKISAESLTALGLNADATEQEVNAAIAAKDQTINDLKAKNKSDQDARAEKLINDAVASGKILGSEKEAFVTDAKANYDLTERMLAKISAKGSLSGQQKNTPEAEADGREKWTHKEWRKNDTVGMLAMKQNEPERYKALCEAAGIKY